MRVAIVRLTSLGDVVHTLPVAHAIRRHDPTSYIAWIVEEREQSLLAGNPVVDEVVVGPTRRWRRQLRSPAGAVRVLHEWRALGGRIKSMNLDVAIDVQGLLKSTFFTLLTRAPIRIGFGWRHAREPLSCLFTTHRVAPPREAAHVVEKNLCLLEPLGIPVEEIAFPLPAFVEAGRKTEAVLHEHRVKPQDRVVVLIPATRRGPKQWPATHYRLLAGRLAKEDRVRVVLLGGPGEEGLLRLIAQGLNGHPIFAFVPSIPEMVAFLREAHLAVGNDTGPLHVAAALGVPTVGLYGPTRSERNGPYGPRARTIQSPTARMEDIPVETVFRSVMEMLA